MTAAEAQNQVQLVVLLAESRIGAELTAAQARGEIALRNEPVSQYVHAADIPAKPTLPDLGISRQRAAEFKQLAAAGDVAIRDEVASEFIEENGGGPGCRLRSRNMKG